MSSNIYSFKVKKIDGTPATLEEYQGKVLLVVNVASKCGLTVQYEGLEGIYKKYRDQGFEVLGFPANNFLSQEPGSNEEIQQFCSAKFGVDFPMFEKISVKGEDQHPLYKFLTESKTETTMKPGGTLMERLKSGRLLGNNENDIKWNFEKFLIGRNGQIVERFSPELEPQDPLVTTAIEKALNQ